MGEFYDMTLEIYKKAKLRGQNTTMSSFVTPNFA